MDMLCNMCVKLSELEVSKSNVMSPEWRLYEHVFVLEFTHLRLKCWTRGGVVVKTLRYKPAGRGFDSR